MLRRALSRQMPSYVRMAKSPSLIGGALSAAAALQSRSYCHAFVPVPVLLPPPPTRILASASTSPSAMQALVTATRENALKAAAFISRAARYAGRLVLYGVLGAPMLVLFPCARTLGDTFPALEHLTWGYMIWAVQTLGPCFIKLAQWASTRPDLFPPRLVSRLIRLQDDVDVHHAPGTVDRTMAEAFGPAWRGKLRLDEKPLGAGSVAQVFKGYINRAALPPDDPNHGQGEICVAVKMIHPHVDLLVRTDMELLSLFAWGMDQFASLEILSLGETCRQFAETMNKQLDLRVEAHNLRTFARKFENEGWAKFPQPVEGFVSKNVLVETLLTGKPISHYMNMDSTGNKALEDLKLKISDLGVRLILKMVFFDNFIHGDLHPGNLMVEVENGEPTMVVLDCGIVYCSRTEEEFKHLVDICIAFMKHDGRAAARHMIQITPETVKSYFEHIGDYVSRICELSRKHLVRLDPGYFRIAMALKVAEGISLSLNRDLDLVSKCIPIIIKAQSLRALGISKFPPPEDDPDRTRDMRAEYEAELLRTKKLQEAEALDRRRRQQK
mmetsp:Transcript_4047/g.8855  ORF Transcript_4047/g.8855 Transcript_4047/m.8855 type:complete len:556 (+) Transcript_4047:192-1859(+)